MSVTDLVSVEQTLLRELEDDELPWVQAMIDYLESLIEMRMPEVMEAALEGGPTAVVLRFVVGEAVSRVLRAPMGGLYKYETEATYTYSINQAVASGVLELTDRDWKNLSAGAKGWGSTDPTFDAFKQRRLKTVRTGVRIPFGETSRMAYPDPFPIESGMGPVNDVDIDVWGEY